MESKWEYRENFHSTGCGDYDGNYEITDGHILLCTNDDPEDVTETENVLQQIARLLNESGCKFYSNNVLELNQHIEIQKQKYEIDDLQAKCDRYEKALKEIRYVHKSSDSSAAWQLNQAQNIAIEALNGEGVKPKHEYVALGPDLYKRVYYPEGAKDSWVAKYHSDDSAKEAATEWNKRRDDYNRGIENQKQDKQ